jgi:4-aminobutyrate aminotransferase-like enzyme
MGTNRELIKKYKEVNLGEVSLSICFHHADNAYLFDHEGNSFLDFTSGFGVTSSGWLRKEIIDVIQKQLQHSAYAPPWLPTEEAIALSEQLLEITPSNLVRCARAIGGADANEIIFKAVVGSNGRNGIISFYRSYHGGTHFTLNISDSPAFHLPQLPTRASFHFVEPPYCYRCPFGKKPGTCNLECTQEIEVLLERDKTIGSFFLEPVIGSGGVIIPPEKYLRRIRELCDKHNIFMVFDEVLTGFGRLGSITASKLFDIKPDAISFAKGMSAGYTAIGAAVLNAELSDSIKKYEDVSGSFAWTPLSCCIATANINLIIKGDLPKNAAILGLYLLQQVTVLFEKYLSGKTGDVRGLGLMIGIELVMDCVTKIPDRKLIQKFIITALRKGLMICASWDFQVIILMPPLNITAEEINDGLNKLESTLKEVSRSFNEVTSIS